MNAKNRSWPDVSTIPESFSKAKIYSVEDILKFNLFLEAL